MAKHTDPQVAGPASGGSGVSPGCGDTTRPPLLSVILVGQRSLARQRHGRYVAGSAAHPARIAPDLAATLIRDHTQHDDDLPSSTAWRARRFGLYIRGGCAP